MFVHSLRDRLDAYRVSIDPLTGQRLETGAWARVYGNRRTSYAADQTIQSKVNSAAIQAGLDLFGWSSEQYGSFRAGIMFGKGSASGDSISRSDRGIRSSNTVDGFAIGAYATWFQHEDRVGGLYVDSWLQHGWFDNTVSGQGLSKESYASRVWAASLEAGYSVPLWKTPSSSWLFDPFAQIIYTNDIAGRHIEAGGTLVRSDGGGKLVSRVGGRFYGQFGTESGKLIEPFVEASWWHNGQADKLFMNSDVIGSDLARNIGEIKAGVRSEIVRNLSLSVDVSAQFGDHNYRQIGGQVGLRYRW